MLMFNIQDPHDEIAPEVRERIEGMAEKILDCIDDIAHDPFEALQALAAVLAYVISGGFANRKSADHAMAVVTMVVASSVEQAERDGNTAWTQGTMH